MFSPDDTIVAISTPPGRGALGVVRLSGREAHRIAVAMLAHTKELEPRRATFARVLSSTPTNGDAAASSIDEAVVTYFQGPRSYTGEDVVEISGHGAPIVLASIVREAMTHGARLAEPGEFTLRAYLHGRIDLVQAEAVADLIDAVTPLQARAAFDQLEGTLTSRIHAIDRHLFDVVTRLEASLDFPDEGYHFITTHEAKADVSALLHETSCLAADGKSGRAVREGRVAAVIGKANVGKSSLFNRLVGSSRAIVTDVPGTTRDVLSETANLRGIPVRLLDTAGLRETPDLIEREGVTRAVDAASSADIVLIVLDGSRAMDEDDARTLRDTRSKRRLAAINKCDLDRCWSASALNGEVPYVEVSARSGEGLDRLEAVLCDALADGASHRDAPIVTNLRHIELLEQTRSALQRAHESLDSDASEEFVLADLQEARVRLEEITGRRHPDELLHTIFGRFCIGK